MNDQAIMTLYILIGAIFATMVLSGIALWLVTRHKKRKSMFSLSTSGSDTSDYADMLAEKLRNERLNEER